MRSMLLAGATDGIGTAAARMLGPQGHTLLRHRRNAAKLADVEAVLSALPGAGRVETYVVDLSRLTEVASLAEELATASGRYFDNDAKRSGHPHPDALDPTKSQALVRVMDALLQVA